MTGQRVNVQLDNGGCALAQRRAQAVRTGVAATDDDDVPALRADGWLAAESPAQARLASGKYSIA